ncbi:MAG: glycosyltransferase family 4 protein [Alphaproteobacteria bacterium]
MSRQTVRRFLLLTPGAGGADGISTLTRQYIRSFAALAAEASAECEVWSLDDAAPPAGTPAAVRMRCAARGRLRFASFGLTARGIDAGTVVVVLHAQLLPVTLPLVARGARLVPVLVGVEVWGPLSRLVQVALRRAWRVLSISRATRDRFAAAHPAFAGLGVAVCEPAVPDTVPPEPAVVDFPRPYALIVGRMAADERYKGHDALIDVWPRVREAVPGATLVVAGTGNDADRLRARAGEGVVFAGPLPAARLAAAYAGAAFFAMPSTGEGFGLVFLEAMRAGRPCLAAPGAAEEILQDGVSGVIVDPADRQRLLAGLVRLFTDETWREGLAAAARRTIDERFRPEQLTARLRAALGAV